MHSSSHVSPTPCDSGTIQYPRCAITACNACNPFHLSNGENGTPRFQLILFHLFSKPAESVKVTMIPQNPCHTNSNHGLGRIATHEDDNCIFWGQILFQVHPGRFPKLIIERERYCLDHPIQSQAECARHARTCTPRGPHQATHPVQLRPAPPDAV